MLKKTKVIVTVFALLAVVVGLNLRAEAKKSAELAGVVNINTATAEELMLLPGIGPSKANAIVGYREAQKFDSNEDLMKVKGVGAKLFEGVQAYITVDGPTTAKRMDTPSINLDTPTAGERS